MAIGNMTGVGGPGNVNFDAMQQLIGAGDMESALIAFGIERAQGMESLVKAKIGDMRERNANIQELQQAMQTIRAAKPTGDDSAKSEYTPAMLSALKTLEKNGVALPQGLTQHDDQAGSGKAALEGKKEPFDDLLTNLQSKIDELTSNDQLDMIQLQSMVSKQNNAIEMVSNLHNKFAQLKDKIVGNMR